MKKTLLASALLLAFSASAMAGTDGRYEYLEGVAETVTEENNVGSIDRVLGGYRTITSEVANQEINGDVSVKGGKWDMAIGGHYFSGYNSDTKVNVKSTKLVIEGATVEQVIGGSGAVGAKNLSFVGVDSTNLTIKSGTFGLEKDGNDTPELLVVGGDLLKFGSYNADDVKDVKAAKSEIGTVNVNINGGTFNSAIIGGSAAIQYYTGKTDADYEVKVGTANTNITGGTFNDAIVAGGFAYGDSTTSHVEEANLSISGASGNLVIKENIYAGGMVGDWPGQLPVDQDINTIISTVGHSNVSIDNATVKNVYGAHANYTFGKHADDSSKNDWYYELHETEKSIVETTLNLTNVEAKTVQVMKGEVNLRATEGKQTIIGDTEDDIAKSLIVGSDVQVSLETDGITNDKYQGDISKAIIIEGWDYKAEKNVSVTMAEGLEYGEVTLVNGKLVEKVNTIKDAMQDIAGTAPIAMARILTNDVRKRLGDLRSAEGTHGVWARYDGGKLSSGNNYENEFNTIQVGIDTVPTPEAGRFGVAFSYTKGDAEIARGDADMEAFSLAAYGTWMSDNGMFVDVIGRMATVDNDLTIGRYTGKTDNVLLSLSGEMGWRFDVTDTLYVEPQAELTYTYVNGDNFKLGYADYETDDTDSLVARLGFAAGMKCPNNMGDVYVRASAVHEFLGDTSVKVGQSAALESDGEDTYVEFGIGAQFNINKNTYVYADVERTEGATLEEDWRANVGVRFAF